MKKLLLLGVMALSVWICAMAGIEEKMSASTQLFIAERDGKISLDVKLPGPPMLSRPPLLRQQPVDRYIAAAERVGGVDMVSCFIHINPNRTAKIESLGVIVQERFNEFVTAMIPVDKIERIAEVPEVLEIKVAHKMQLRTNQARYYTNTDDVINYSNDAILAGLPQAFKGTGVVVGVVDTGIDFQHVMFKNANGTTRIKKAYSNNSEANVNSATTDYSGESHGTHTSSIAGGSNITYSGTTYGGMAPESDLVLVGCGESLYNTYISNGIKKIFDYADSQNKPAVCSLSLGSHMGPHDGTGEFASLHAQYGGTHANHIIVYASGNEAGNGSSTGFVHAEGNASSSTPFSTVINGYASYTKNALYYGYDVFYARRANQQIACKLHLVNTSNNTVVWTSNAITSSTNSVSGATNYLSSSPTVTIARDSYSGKYYVQLAFSSVSKKSNYSNSAFAIAVSVYPTNGSCMIDAWDVHGYNYFANYSRTIDGYTFVAGTDAGSAGDEATDDNVISVGAYASKRQVTDYRGASHTLSEYTVGDIAYFSSYQTAGYGPTGVAKPDICAPGATIVSGVNHYDSDFLSNGYSSYGYYCISNNGTSSLGSLDGTSMATPCAAGIIALYLQAAKYANKTLNTEGIRDVFANSAIHDNYTNKPNFGRYGKINALEGIKYILGSTPMPTPELTVNPTSLSFTTNVGQSVTKTFTVTGTNLTGNVNVDVSGSNYSVTPTTITPAQASAGATVTVTYNPSAAGNHTGTVTLTSAGADNKTVSLTGTATTVPTITVNPAALTFNTTVGTPVTQTINVQGADLTATVYVAVQGTGFTIDKTSITRSQANAGTTVTVTYNPTAAGNHTGTVTFTSVGATTQTVTLNGTAVGVPTITATPTSLTFNTTVGEPVTKTFTVTGTDLTGNISLAVQGTGFTIDKTSITRNQATNGATVTVTYNPNAGGNHTGTVTLTSNGAQTKTVSLNGTATTIPVLTVNPAALTFNTTVGTPVTQTINVQGADLTATVYVAVQGTGFTIDKTSITRSQANAGTTVTVTYNPTAVGNHTGTVTFTSAGATTQTVTLNGNAVGVPTITATPTSLTFNTTVGEPVTKTFTVTGTDLTGNISLSVQGTGFTIDKTSIPRPEATNGVTVTVTYNPNAGGNHTGTVTLTSNGAQPKTVSLNGTATTIPALTVNPTTLNMVTTVGTPVTQTFTVTGANLTGNISLSVQGTGFTIDKTSIPRTEATNGSTVTVTYNPTTFGIHTGTVTITSNGAEPVTVTLNGQADLVKFAPVMLPAIEEYIDLTQFRADWTDETPAQNVASYTLEVNPKPVAPPAELIASLSGTQFSGNQYYAVTLSYPWAGTNTRGHNNEIIYFRNNYDGDGSYGNITYTIPAGYENATFTMKITSGTNATEAVGNLTVATPQTAGVTHYFNPSETYAWVVTASSGDKITITTPDAQYSPDIALIEVYSGDATTMMMMATETGDAYYRLITDITDRFYTVENLTAEGTFLYRVKALYLDGTESDWSNVEEVTLFQQSHGYDVGDVNHDGIINIKDVTDLIDALLETGEVCEICADVKADGVMNIADVTSLIDLLLESPSRSIKSRTSAGFERPGDRLYLKF